MEQDKYDVIVIGTGSMGSATCFQLAAAGHKVLGLEQFDTIPHEQGAHGGQSRIIRKAYFEHPGYVPLLERAYENWRKLEKLVSEQVFYRTGLLYCGDAQHEVIKGVKQAASGFGIDLHSVRGGLPAYISHFRNNKDDELLLEPDAGFLLPGKIISLYIREALKKGAVIHTGEKVVEWKKENGWIKVLTSRSAYHAKKLIITAGAWSEPVIKELRVPLRVTRQVIFWVEPANITAFSPENFPCWLIARNDGAGAWHGFPYLSGEKFPGPGGLKFALHYRGEETDPDQVRRDVSGEEVRLLIDDAKKYFLPAGNKIIAVKTCLYTNTSDEHFIIDHLPGYDGDVTIACGFSGHGFKFVSVVGEILSDLSMKGKTDLPAGFLGLKRFF